MTQAAAAGASPATGAQPCRRGCSTKPPIVGMVKRILNKYGYPPDLQDEAVKTVLEQAKLLCAEWV